MGQAVEMWRLAPRTALLAGFLGEFRGGRAILGALESDML